MYYTVFLNKDDDDDDDLFSGEGKGQEGGSNTSRLPCPALLLLVPLFPASRPFPCCSCPLEIGRVKTHPSLLALVVSCVGSVYRMQSLAVCVTHLQFLSISSVFKYFNIISLSFTISIHFHRLFRFVSKIYFR